MGSSKAKIGMGTGFSIRILENMRGNGEMIERKVVGLLFIMKGILITENGLMINYMDMEFILQPIKLINMKENGIKI